MAKKDVALLLMLSALKLELRANTYALLTTCGRAEASDVVYEQKEADKEEQDALKTGGVFDLVSTKE